MVRPALAVALILIAAQGAAGQPPPDAALDAVLARMAAYVAAYGEKVSLIVAVEKYTQTAVIEGAPDPSRPRSLVAEFALVKAAGNAGWVGFRDVVEVDGTALRDRRDRLVSLFTNTTGDASEVTRIANESARFNVGPVMRNFNVPTAAMFFFLSEHLPRFQFSRRGVKKIEGVNTWEIAFKETRSPTFVMTRAGADVPLDGTLWINPEDGTVVRTRLHMTHFADQMTAPTQAAPEQVPQTNPNGQIAGRTRNVEAITWKPIDSSAEIDVTFQRHAQLGIWLPLKMEEVYAGPIRLAMTTSAGRATTQARYSDFKQFNTSSSIVLPK